MSAVSSAALNPTQPPTAPHSAAAASASAASANSLKPHQSLSERVKDRLSRFRHKDKDNSVTLAPSAEPPSPAVSLGTPDSPSQLLAATSQSLNSAFTSAATSPTPISNGRPVTPSLLSSLPAPTLSQSTSTAALTLPPAGGSGSKPIKRSKSSSPAVSPSLSPMPSASGLQAVPTVSLNGSPAAGTLSISHSPSLSSLSLPQSLPLPLLSSFSRPHLGNLYIRVVEGRNLGPASSRTMRTHLLVFFENAAPTRSPSFSGVNPFYGHNVQCDVTDITHDVVVVVVEEHQLRKDTAVGQLIVPLTSLLATDLHPKCRHFTMDEWIELYPANYDEGPNDLFYHKWPSNEHRITGAGMRKPNRWPIGQLHVKLELALNRSVSSCYIISQPFGTRKPDEQKKKGKDAQQLNKDATVITNTTLAPINHASIEQNGDILEPITPVPTDGSLVVRSVAPEFHGPTFKRNFRRLQRLYNEPAHWLHYARLCQQWESPPLSVFAILILYALCFNTHAHHVPLLVFAAIFLTGLASAFRSPENESDIITFDTEAIPSEWLKEGYMHKFRRWRGVLGRASFVLGQIASRLEQLSAAFNWSDGHLSLLVYAMLGGVLASMSLLFYLVPVGVVVMVLGCGWMLDGLLAALKRWELDHHTLLKMQRALAELEAMSDRNGRRRLITDNTPLPTPTSNEGVLSAAPGAVVPAAILDGGSSKKEREESKRVAEVSAGSTPPKRRFFGLRRRIKSNSGSKVPPERMIVTSFDDQQLPSSADIQTTPSGRARGASVDSAPDFSSRASTPDSTVSISPSLSPHSAQARLPQQGPLHPSSSWPYSLAETRLSASASTNVEGAEVNAADALSVGPPLPPRLMTRLLQMCPSLATVRSYLLTLQAMLPLFLDVARLLWLYFRMACRHLASRAPDSLEVAHRVIAARAMKDHSVTDSEKTVKKRSTHREAVRQRKKQQDMASAAASAASRHSGGSTHHNALAHQLTQVYQSIHRARTHSGAASAVIVTSPPTGAGVPPLSRAAPSAVAAGMAGGSRVVSVDNQYLSAHVDHSPFSPASDASGAQWESDSDDDVDDGSDDSGGSSDDDD